MVILIRDEQHSNKFLHTLSWPIESGSWCIAFDFFFLTTLHFGEDAELVFFLFLFILNRPCVLGMKLTETIAVNHSNIVAGGCKKMKNGEVRDADFQLPLTPSSLVSLNVTCIRQSQPSVPAKAVGTLYAKSSAGSGPDGSYLVDTMCMCMCRCVKVPLCVMQ